jgi:hypothetical protein
MATIPTAADIHTATTTAVMGLGLHVAIFCRLAAACGVLLRRCASGSEHMVQ